MKISDLSPEILKIGRETEERIRPQFDRIDDTAFVNTKKVVDAFREYRVSEACFAGTTGYGYDDLGRDTLDKVYARVFGSEAALVRTTFVNGTHALTAALFALAAPGETILSVTGNPYDTLRQAIGLEGEGFGSLRFYGIRYAQTELLPDGTPDFGSIREALERIRPKAVILQRSRGYEDRKALSVEEIAEICSLVKGLDPSVLVMVDNCYGEFTQTLEPTEVGADLIAGSLIKNPGGGLAPTGGYIAGKKELVDRAAARLTSPGIGRECGSTNGMNRLLYQGLFMAPHTVVQALKTALFCAGMMEALGFETSPRVDEIRPDIIQMIRLETADNMKAFCAGIQAGAAVDSYVTPEPWQMPGYDCPVIMAAGAFIQGSSIELSADGPFREPYRIYMQGGLTYESGKLGVMMAAERLLALRKIREELS